MPSNYFSRLHCVYFRVQSHHLSLCSQVFFKRRIYSSTYMYKYRYSVSIKLFSIMGFLAIAAAMRTGKKWENCSQISGYY
jgi:hypothetical protein